MDPIDIIDVYGPLGMDPMVQAERARLEAAFMSCISRFNDRDQTLIRMWWEGYTGEETGAELGMLPNNVYQRRLYLFRQLRACLVEKLPEYFSDV
jgi:DNA-directed RNA polymerase specialized sigma24 family protein